MSRNLLNELNQKAEGFVKTNLNLVEKIHKDKDRELK